MSEIIDKATKQLMASITKSQAKEEGKADISEQKAAASTQRLKHSNKTVKSADRLPEPQRVRHVFEFRRNFSGRLRWPD